jgi:hypothetical protein
MRLPQKHRKVNRNWLGGYRFDAELESDFTQIIGYCAFLAVEMIMTTGNTQIKNLNFGEALAHLKNGYCVARDGWNGKGMWLALIKGATVQQAIADCYGNNGETFPVLDAVYMKTADGSLVPWLCSQTDMLAEDWTILPSSI